MTEVKNSKKYAIKERRLGFWSFGFRYCLVFRASDLEFDCLNYAQLFKAVYIDSIRSLRGFWCDQVPLHQGTKDRLQAHYFRQGRDPYGFPKDLDPPHEEEDCVHYRGG